MAVTLPPTPSANAYVVSADWQAATRKVNASKNGAPDQKALEPFVIGAEKK